MERSVSTRLVFSTTADTKIALAITAARNPGYTAFSEELSITANGADVPFAEIADAEGGRIHYVEIPEASVVTVDYSATLAGRAISAEIPPVDLIRYVRPSRYAESDRLLPTAYAEFGGLDGGDLILAVREWVARELSYVSGSSRGTDGAVETLLHRRGVCRDFAHLAIALLRSKDIPARLVAVYAPGLMPMDFHAVAEAYLDGQWHVIDPTGLAPRTSMVRISVGRDAADTAFLSTVGGRLTLKNMQVTAVVNGDLPVEDYSRLEVLG